MMRAARFLMLAFVAATGATALVAQPTEVVNWTAGVQYSYDGSGSITAIGSDAFVYDDVGRLVQAEVNSDKRNYTYDQYGNRTGCTSISGGDCLFGWTVDRNNNRINSMASYDASGNVEVLGPRRYSYDALNMMTLDQASAFVYTADDERIATYKSDTGEWHWTLRDMGNKVLRELTSKDNGGTFGKSGWTWKKDYVWRDDMLLASRQHDGTATTTFHYHLDHLGTPRRITDQKDAIVGFHDYLAFGREKSGKNEIPLADLKYTGHERDLDVTDQYSLDYMHARFYNPAAGRFLSVDPILGIDNALPQPQMWNRYHYALSSPLSFTDPTGTDVYVVTYGKDFRGEKEFKRAAETKAAEIEAGQFFDPKYDKVLLMGVKTKAGFSSVIAMANALEPTYGKIYELHHYSHSGEIDGPVFKFRGGLLPGTDQWTPDELMALKINWGTNAVANFHGCYTGKAFSSAFAKAQGVTTYGQPRFSYFSSSPLERREIGTTGPVYLISAPGLRNPGPLGVSWLDYATGFKIRDPMVESKP